jgi:hypothetical protein
MPSGNERRLPEPCPPSPEEAIARRSCVLDPNEIPIGSLTRSPTPASGTGRRAGVKAPRPERPNSSIPGRS